MLGNLSQFFSLNIHLIYFCVTRETKSQRYIFIIVIAYKNGTRVYSLKIRNKFILLCFGIIHIKFNGAISFNFSGTSTANTILYKTINYLFAILRHVWRYYISIKVS